MFETVFQNLLAVQLEILLNKLNMFDHKIEVPETGKIKIVVEDFQMFNRINSEIFSFKN